MNSVVTNELRVVAAALDEAGSRLTSAGIATARLDAELLLAHAWGCSRTRVVAGMGDVVPVAVGERFATLVAQREQREPLAYIVGRQEFWSLDLEITHAVLIPRPETEMLVETALRWVRERATARPRIADVGTGSGCIALALASELPRAEIWASDASAAALAVAQRNAARLGLASRIAVRFGDLFEPLRVEAPFDLICANPPYVAVADAATLSPEVLCEPAVAVFADAGGFDVICRVIVDARRLLTPTGVLLVEIGAGQSDEVRSLARATGYARVDIVNDYAGLPRLLVARMAG